ncbi:MAG TPA: hypothetical protein VHA53_04330 [Nitrolancea sp.]|nr:hypothetical protein [Nitrolancea sp.]
MTVEHLTFLQRLRLAFRLIWSGIWGKQQRPTETRFSAPASWKKLPKPTGPAPDLGELMRLIPIMERQNVNGVTMTLISLETYEGGFLVHGQFPAKYGERSHENMWMAHPTFMITDDIGTDYGWYGSREDGTRFLGRFSPAPNPAAHELRVTVTHIQWIFHRTQRHELDEGPWEFTIPLE